MIGRHDLGNLVTNVTVGRRTLIGRPRVGLFLDSGIKGPDSDCAAFGLERPQKSEYQFAAEVLLAIASTRKWRFMKARPEPVLRYRSKLFGGSPLAKRDVRDQLPWFEFAGVPRFSGVVRR